MVDGASTQTRRGHARQDRGALRDRVSGPRRWLAAHRRRRREGGDQPGGTQVLFDGVPAPILYTSSGQVAAVVPYEVDGKPGTQVQVRNGSLSRTRWRCPCWRRALDFLGRSERHRTVRGPESGRDHGELREDAGRQRQLISIYATGEGQTEPGGIDGRITTGGSLPSPIRQVQAWVDGKPAEVQYAARLPMRSRACCRSTCASP